MYATAHGELSPHPTPVGCGPTFKGKSLIWNLCKSGISVDFSNSGDLEGQIADMADVEPRTRHDLDGRRTLDHVRPPKLVHLLKSNQESHLINRIDREITLDRSK